MAAFKVILDVKGTRSALVAALDEELRLYEDDYGSERYELACAKAWSAMGSACRDQLKQLLKKGPTYDGDVASKSARDALLEFGLASRACVNFEFGFTVANYRGGYIYKHATKYFEKSERPTQTGGTA